MNSSSDSASPPPSNRARRRLRKFAYLLGAALLLYVALGFFAVPPIVRAVANAQVDAHLHARLQMESVSFNPFTLRLRLEGLSLRDLEEDEVLRLEEGQFALSLSSVVHFAPVLKEVLLNEPGIFATRNAEGELNLERLLKEKEEDPEPFEMPKVAINRLSLSGGTLELRDDALEEPFSFSISPISFDLEDFSTFHAEGNQLRFSATAPHGGEVRGNGTFTVEPITAAAELELENFDLSALALYLREVIDVDLREGALDLQLAATFQADSQDEMIAGNLQSLALSDIELVPSGSETPFLTVGRAEVSNAKFGAWGPRVDVESVRIAGGQAHVRRLEDGTIDWIQMLLPDAGAEAEPREEPGDPLELAFAVSRVEVHGFQFTLDDLATGSAARLQGTLDRGEVVSITEDLSRPVPFDLEGTLFGDGHFRLAGNLAPSPLAGEIDLNVETIPLPPFDPWVGAFADLSPASGTGGVNGKITLAEGTGELPDISFAGTAGVDNFEARDGEEPVLKFAQLELNELDVQSEPLSFRSGLIRLDSPDGQVGIEEDGRLNLQRLLRLPAPDEPAGELATPAESPHEALPLTYAVAAIEVEEGKIALFDRSITPHYATQIEGITVSVLELASEPESRATVNAGGRFADSSRLEITGTTNAHAAQPFADLTIQMAGFELPPVSPYSGKFIGRAISSGSLDIEVIATVDGENLSARNAILLKDLRLGDRMESPEAPSLPLDLALALLRDRNGEISIDLPISGQLDDPQFSIASVATDAFFSVIRNIASSPFAALGNLIGAESEQLSQVDFSPGQFVPPEKEKEVLRELAEALYQRPALHLEARGMADPDADRPALKERLLAEELEAHRATLATNVDTMEDGPLNDPDLVRSYYEERFGPLETKAEPVEETPDVAEETPEETSPEVRDVSDEEAVAKAEEAEPRSWIAIELFGRTIWPRAARNDEPEQEVAETPVSAPEEPTEPEKTEKPEEPDPVVEIPTMEEMKERLLGSVEVSEEDLHELARSRAEAVRAALLETGRVEDDRVSIGAASLEAGPKVQFDLR